MNSLYFIALAAAGTALAVFLVRRYFQNELMRRVDSCEYAPLTRLGVDVRIENGVAVPDQDLLDAIDRGLQETFNRAKALGDTKALRHHDYMIAFLKAHSERDGIPVFRVKSGKYRNSHYDKGGFMFAAGVAVDPKECIIAIPEHKPGQQTALARIVGYEAEHCIARANDRELYERTKVHGGLDGHPIF